MNKFCSVILTICLAAAFEPVTAKVGPEHSGSWFNPSEDGHGFSFEYGQSGTSPFVVVYWYTYSSDGGPIFLVGAGAPNEEFVDVTFTVSWGMEFGVFDPNSVQRETAGVGRFSFDNDASGTFSYTPTPFAESALGHVPVTTQITKAFDVVSDEGGEKIVEVPVYIEVPVYVENAIVSNVVNNFSGFQSGNLFELSNGMIFQQTEFYYWYHYAYRPDIVIYERNGSWHASVDGIGEHVTVVRVK